MITLPRFFLFLVLWVLYSLIAYKGCYPCWSEVFCNGCGLEAAATSEGLVPADDSTAVATTPAPRGPLDFKWSDATPNINVGFDAYKKSILDQMTDNNILEITGIYYEGEENTSEFPNMGFWRANQIKQLFLNDLPEERIKLRARADTETEGLRSSFFPAAAFSWLTADQPKKAETIEELDDRILIRFAFNSLQQERNPAIDAYLNKLADRVKQTNERITLTGHTDNVGTPERNQQLGLDRAKVIQDILIRKGVNAALISISSKGETQPVDSNDTDEGRHNNRRVEVRLIKN